jgi:hypothetical protein
MDQTRETERENRDQHAKRPYVPPAIIWEEDYRPTAFGVSCAKQPGNPGCVILMTT